MGIASVTIARGSQRWATTYDYNEGYFHDFGTPWRTTESGGFSREITRTFRHQFTPHYIVGRLESETTTCVPTDPVCVAPTPSATVWVHLRRPRLPADKDRLRRADDLHSG